MKMCVVKLREDVRLLSFASNSPPSKHPKEERPRTRVAE